MKWSNFYLKVPPIYRNKGVEKWTKDIKLAYRFDNRDEAEEMLDILPNNKNIKIKLIKEEDTEKKEEKPVTTLLNDKNGNVKNYGVVMKYKDYEVSMTFVSETEKGAIDKIIEESIGRSGTIDRPLMIATLKPK